MVTCTHAVTQNPFGTGSVGAVLLGSGPTKPRTKMVSDGERDSKHERTCSKLLPKCSVASRASLSTNGRSLDVASYTILAWRSASSFSRQAGET